MKPTDEAIINDLRTFDAYATKTYFYGYCRRAYKIYDYKYQLHNKSGLDFYSLAHEYYIQLLIHDFAPLLAKPKHMKLSTWMTQGFHFVVLDALKAYNRAFEHQATESSDVVLEYLRSNDQEDDMMQQVVYAVEAHYQDRAMSEIARLIFYDGYKQKEVAEQLGITPAAVNQRYKKMMEQVVTPFIIENYGRGIYQGQLSEALAMDDMSLLNITYGNISPSSAMDNVQCCLSSNTPMQTSRITPDFVRSLKANEVFVFGSNLQGIHAGGAARTALRQFGAQMGCGVGLQGQSYAIPTMQGGVDTIRPYVDDFIAFAQQHPGMHFLVTPIGCGIAGFEASDIAPLFQAARNIPNISLPQSFWDELPEDESTADPYNLARFVAAQEYDWQQALKEVTEGLKRSHWIWYIFPQIAGLGCSRNSQFYGLSNREEAQAYLRHPILGDRLREITQALMQHKTLSASTIFGGLDAMKVKSCMTIFDAVSPHDIFEEVLHTFFNDNRDHRTLTLLQDQDSLDILD